ncbi:MAG TPA: hypothetical protein PK303_09350, partial [bacterium]|nr:hypothetical protein [bacterium]
TIVCTEPASSAGIFINLHSHFFPLGKKIDQIILLKLFHPVNREDKQQKSLVHDNIEMMSFQDRR